MIPLFYVIYNYCWEGKHGGVWSSTNIINVLIFLSVEKSISFFKLCQFGQVPFIIMLPSQFLNVVLEEFEGDVETTKTENSEPR